MHHNNVKKIRRTIYSLLLHNRMIKHDDIFTSAQRNTTEPKHNNGTHCDWGVDMYTKCIQILWRSQCGANGKKHIHG